MTDVLIKRELLERLAGNGPTSTLSATRELREILAAPRQPEGDGLEVVATLEIGDYSDPESIYARIEPHKEFTIDEVCEDDKLVRLSDAQRAIAELRGLTPELPPRPPEGEGMPRYGLRWNGPQQPVAVPMDDGYWTPWHLAEAERDTLRQQLAEWDATIERLEAGIPRIQEQSHQMRQQRDKLAGLLRDALKLGELDRVLSLRTRALAALAEVSQ